MPEQIYARNLKVGDVLFREGAEGDDAYIVESGSIEISLDLPAGKKVLATLGKGEILGEMSLIADAPRSATAIAAEDSELLVLKRDRLLKPIEAADPIMRLMIQMIVDRLRDAPRWMKEGDASLPEVSKARQKAFDEVRELALRRIQIEGEMRQAIDVPELELHYQPIINLKTGILSGYEALMRWTHPVRGFVSPGEFIPLAEETGMIVEMGRWALATGLRDHLAMLDAFKRAFPGEKPPFVSVNVSGRQLFELSEIDVLRGIIEDSGVDPQQIKLEITESLMVHDAEHAAVALKRLKELGILLAIDDFGTGYSSLSYLHRFPFDTLKIDRAFVVNMSKDESAHKLVHAIASMAIDLGLDIVAEGIEERDEFDTLAGFGCHYGQGFFMARPSPISNNIELIENATTW
jgi:EAL domain-containing protein (putative c-di-GMP-specific phosphodiesterase class I)/CRP-like cAMP-binding protein